MATIDVRLLCKVAGVCVVTFFLLTTLTLHLILEGIDDQDVMSPTNDWRRTRLGRRVEKVVGLVSRSHLADDAAVVRRRGRRGGGGKAQPPPLLQKQEGPTQRELFEAKYPPTDSERIRSAVAKLRKPEPETVSPGDMKYDIRNCPPIPPAGYPYEWKLVDEVLTNWNPDDTSMPTGIYQGLCVFDFDKPTDRIKILAYRKAEVPFVTRNQPELLKAVERWNSYENESDPSSSYLHRLIGNKPQRNEYSKNNHFMFWRLAKGGKNKTNLRGKRPNNQIVPPDWAPPTKNVELSFAEWYDHAAEIEKLSPEEQVQHEHWYFRLNADYLRVNNYLYDEFPMFVPDLNHPDEIFMSVPEEARGINCRAGMQGVIAESHFDSSRNWIFQMGPGQRRYILSHPSQCRNLELYPVNHPSGRHSSVNWSEPDKVPPNAPFRQATANEVLLMAGDALYLPTSWFHFIVSLNRNYQCNARSGHSFEFDRFIEQCLGDKAAS